MADNNRKKFIDLVANIATIKKSSQLLSELQYEKTLMELRIASEKTTRKTAHEYRLLKRYSILKIDGIEKLIEKQKQPDDPVLYVVPIEQVSSSFVCLMGRQYYE